MKRRRFLAGIGAALAAPAVAQTASEDVSALLAALPGGAGARRGRVKIDLPVLADNGNAVPVKVTVQSPMTASDHVKTIRLLSERNPVRDMATFHVGPRMGRAEIASRIRLAGSQRIVAVAEMSDGSLWYDAAPVAVTASACMDES